ncbi:PAS domain S-box-containing protein [Inhella inkyongensis]|uniref:Virulence sensor protein BvgS n=1 Tax=Inhella inkyongensis TaxID=392593 RepID=A0A840S6L1_9BURK|nr:ATP-binding protein [Inhella inkyongensis]MBB5206075.1 PAS domain S-box-containing protein [Inhella inkyongensis]
MRLPNAPLHPAAWSLRLRLVVASSLALALTGALLVVALTWRGALTARDEMQERLHSQLRTVGSMVLDQAVVGDFTLIQRILDERVRDDDVFKLCWRAPQGMELQAQRPPEGEAVPAFFVAWLGLDDLSDRLSLSVGGVSYGSLEVRISAATAYENLWAGFVTGWQILLLALIVNGLAIHGLVAVGLRPLKALNEATRRFGEGEREVRLPEQGPAELQAALSSFNRTAGLVQQTLKDLEDQRRAIGNGALVVDLALDGRLLDASPSFFELLGYARSDLIGQPCSQVQCQPPDAAQQQLQFETMMRRGVWRDDLVVRAADGRELCLHHAMTPVLGEDGQPERFICIAFDVTEQRRAESQLAQAKLAAEAASQAKSRFLSTMSHEIRTPLNGVLGMAELLSYTPLLSDQKRFVQGIQSAGKALHELLSDILDLAQVEEERLQLEVLPFEPARLMDEVAVLFRPLAQARRNQFELDAQGLDSLWVAGDASRLRQVLSNLLGNANKFTEGGVVRLSVRAVTVQAEKVELHIAITDTGVGMSAEALGKLFERFGQAEASTHRRYGGSGLGLVICKHIVELMGSRIEVSSREGQGSCFEFRLNLVRLEPAAAPQPAAASISPGLRVLVAEDNLINQKVVARLLERLQATVVLVDDGAQALREVQQQSFDLVLMDCQMPELDGIEATRRIRALPAPFVQPPIVALTANAFAEDRRACLAAGMDDFLSKPVSGERLAELLARLPTLRP